MIEYQKNQASQLGKKKLEHLLCGAAEFLRGQIDASDYKQYISGPREIQKALMLTLAQFGLSKDKDKDSRSYAWRSHA